MSKNKENNPTKFGLKKILLIIAGLIIPIIGPILVIRSKRFKKIGKIIAGIWLALTVIPIFIPTENNNTNVAQEEVQESKKQNEAEVINASKTEEQIDTVKEKAQKNNNSKNDKNIIININNEYKINEAGKLIYKINSNLPENMNIMFSLESKNNDYYAQSQTKVKKDGYIESKPFSNNGEPLKSGEYIINVTSPKPSIQPENVKEIIGKNGDNITGEFISDGMLDFKNEFDLNNKYDIDYFIAEKEDISMKNATRYNWNVVIKEPITPKLMKFVSKNIIENAKQKYEFNALSLMFYDYKKYIGHGYTLGKTTYAPDGDWAKANTVKAGNYSSMDYVFNFRKKDWEMQLTEKEVEIWSEIQKEYDLAYENTKATETVNEDKIHQKVADAFNISKDKVSKIHMKKVTWDFNDLSNN